MPFWGWIAIGAVGWIVIAVAMGAAIGVGMRRLNRAPLPPADLLKRSSVCTDPGCRGRCGRPFVVDELHRHDRGDLRRTIRKARDGDFGEPS